MRNLQLAFAEEEVSSTTEAELNDVYKPFSYEGNFTTSKT